MQIHSLKLWNFRNYERRDLKFGSKTVIVGENGTGKSNIVEAVYLLAIGKSFRADSDVEMVSWGKGAAGVEGRLGNEIKLTVRISDGSLVRSGKKYEVNDVPRRSQDLVGNLRAILFGPADMELISGSPGARRRYLDFVISQIDREYRRSLVSYEKGIRQRNRLLGLIREGKASRSQLFFWDKLVIKNGEELTSKRGMYLDGIMEENGLGVEYDKSIISEGRLKQYEIEEVASATTLVGPHRDNFLVKLDGRDISKYGSRGQQRMAMMWLKMYERNRLTGDMGVPVMLLDDIFSELDHRHRDEVLELIGDQVKKGGQVIMTTADEHLVPEGDGWEKVVLG